MYGSFLELLKSLPWIKKKLVHEPMDELQGLYKQVGSLRVAVHQSAFTNCISASQGSRRSTRR